VIQVAIIEDEKPAARRLGRLLEKNGLQVSQLLHSVQEAVSWFKENPHPELIFLDIQLSDGLSFDIFKQVDIKSFIIFTTAYDEYALQAFKLNSIDYLLKPIDEVELVAAIQKYQTQQAKNQSFNFDFETVKKMLFSHSETNYKQRISVKIGQQIKLIPVDSIECFYTRDKAAYLFTDEGRQYLIDETLDEMETLLDPKNFSRVSRQFIVQINAIKNINVYSNSRLLVSLQHFDETDIIVSRERVKDFKALL
jgi:DNA-binding LytR/AlgR family response regulator